MDDSFQFIIESPQSSQGHKKRPRLVTSCDNCRLKKVKCIQSTPETHCEACRAAKIPCRFRDRERYFAERSRSIAGPLTTSSTQLHHVNKGLVSHSLPDQDHGSTSDLYKRVETSQSSASNNSFPSASYSSPPPHPHQRSSSYSPSSSSNESEGHTQYQAYPSEQRRIMQNSYQRHSPSGSIVSSEGDSSHGRSPSESVTAMYDRASSHAPVNIPTPRQSLQLFDPEQVQCPHRSLMPHFIQLFFQNMGTQCPFITHDEIQDKSRRGSLPPLLSNGIASAAVRFSTVPDLISKGLHNIADTYAENAKNILPAVVNQPSIDNVHALMVLAWSECKTGRAFGFRGYSDMAMTMAVDIGLSEAGVVNSYGIGPDRARVTWSSLVQLHFYASSTVNH